MVSLFQAGAGHGLDEVPLEAGDDHHRDDGEYDGSCEHETIVGETLTLQVGQCGT
jgi:putative hemolysin